MKFFKVCYYEIGSKTYLFTSDETDTRLSHLRRRTAQEKEVWESKWDIPRRTWNVAASFITTEMLGCPKKTRYMIYQNSTDQVLHVFNSVRDMNLYYKNSKETRPEFAYGFELEDITMVPFVIVE